MKYDGEKIEGATIKTMVVPFGDKEYIIKAQAVLDYTDFYNLCPTPKPPEIVRRGGEKALNTEDPDYKNKINRWSQLKTDYMFWKSLQASDRIEFETVDPANPDTWGNIKDELSQVFTDYVISMIYGLVMEVNGLDQTKIEKATQSFLQQQGATPRNGSSPSIEQNNMQSGELVNDSR